MVYLEKILLMDSTEWNRIFITWRQIFAKSLIISRISWHDPSRQQYRQLLHNIIILVRVLVCNINVQMKDETSFSEVHPSSK